MDYSLLLGVHHTSHQVPLMSPSPLARHDYEHLGSVGSASWGAGAGAGSVVGSVVGNGSPGSFGGARLSLSPVGFEGSVGAGAVGGAGAGAAQQGRDFASSSESYGGPMGSAGRAAEAQAQLLYHDNLMPMAQFRKDDGGVQASIIEGPGIYFFGLIDILQEYNTNKKMEQ